MSGCDQLTSNAATDEYVLFASARDCQVPPDDRLNGGSDERYISRPTTISVNYGSVD